MNISTPIFTQLQYTKKLKTTNLRFTLLFIKIGVTDKAHCLEHVGRLSLLTPDNSEMCLAFHETAATFETSRRLIKGNVWERSHSLCDSLRGKRFRRAFRRFEAFFAF